MAEPDGARAVDADGGHQDQGGDDDAAGVGEIDLVLHNVAHADRGNHTAEDEAHAAL